MALEAIALLTPYPGNARRGDIGLIMESLAELGQYKPVVVDQNGVILAGNHTVQAAEQLGWIAVDTHRVNVTEAVGRKINLIDNRANDVATYDVEALIAQLQEVEDLNATGYTTEDIDQLVASMAIGGRPGDMDPDDVPPVDRLPVSREGDIWQLGPHRLLCGSGTNAHAVRHDLMTGGELADVLWTDPPYGVDYVGGTGLKIQGDTKENLTELLDGLFATAMLVCRPGAALYVAHADTERVRFETSMLNAGMLVRQNLLWVKNSIVMGRSDYHYQHEPILAAEAPEPDEAGDDGELAEQGESITHDPILYGFKPGTKLSGRLGRGGKRWFGGNNHSTVFMVDKPAANKDHPTMKPTLLIEQMLAVSCRPNGIVLDVCGGSGSTLIAADRHGARARVVEIDPLYVDVICRRWLTYSGAEPVRDQDGITFSEAALIA